MHGGQCLKHEAVESGHQRRRALLQYKGRHKESIGRLSDACELVNMYVCTGNQELVGGVCVPGFALDNRSILQKSERRNNKNDATENCPHLTGVALRGQIFSW